MLNVDLSFCLHCLHTALVAQLVNTRELCCFVKCAILSDYLFFLSDGVVLELVAQALLVST